MYGTGNVGRRTQLPCPLWAHYSPRTFTWSPTHKLSKSLPFGFLWRLHHIGMVNEIIGHWQLVPSPAPLPSLWVGKDGRRGAVGGRGGWGGTESPSLLIMVGPPGKAAPILRRFAKVTLLTQTRCVWKGFGVNNETLLSPCWLCSYFRNWWQKTKYDNKRCPYCSYIGND